MNIYHCRYICTSWQACLDLIMGRAKCWHDADRLIASMYSGEPPMKQVTSKALTLTVTLTPTLCLSITLARSHCSRPSRDIGRWNGTFSRLSSRLVASSPRKTATGGAWERRYTCIVLYCTHYTCVLKRILYREGRQPTGHGKAVRSPSPLSRVSYRMIMIANHTVCMAWQLHCVIT